MIFTDMQDIAKLLTDAGVRAVVDPRRIDPPCVLVVPQRADFDTNCLGEGTTTWSLHVLAGQPGGLESMKDLSYMAAKVLAAVPGIESVELTSYDSGTGDPLPAFDFTLRTISGWS